MPAPLTIQQTILAFVALIIFIEVMRKINERIHRTPSLEKPKA